MSYFFFNMPYVKTMCINSFYISRVA